MKTLRASDIMKVCFGLVSFAMLSGGCATARSDQTQPIAPALHEVSDIIREDVEYPVDAYDPWEGFNRRMYRFNYLFDKYLFLPVVRGYEFVTPDIAETGVSNFWNNVTEAKTLANSILQLKGRTSVAAIERFAINTTIGVAGLWDHATRFGIEQEREDFGQTLGHYRVGAGPYLVIPVFGPSTLRDGIGLAADSALESAVISPLDLSGVETAVLSAFRAVDTRHKVEFRYYQTGSPFEYDLVRMLYLSKRKLEITR